VQEQTYVPYTQWDYNYCGFGNVNQFVCRAATTTTLSSTVIKETWGQDGMNYYLLSNVLPFDQAEAACNSLVYGGGHVVSAQSFNITGVQCDLVVPSCQECMQDMP
jgi:hypothetical protein